MSDQAYVYVKNKLDNTGSISAVRHLPDGSEASEPMVIANGIQRQITLLGLDEWVVVNAPEGVDPSTCYVAVKSDVDVDISYCWNAPNWTIKIAPNDSPANTPTTMNVTVGDDEPD